LVLHPTNPLGTLLDLVRAATRINSPTSRSRPHHVHRRTKAP